MGKKYVHRLNPERTSEYGHLGFDGQRVQCHICGQWYRNLIPHVWAKHGSPAMEYREEFGLASGNPLMAPDVSAKLSEAATTLLNDGRGAAAAAAAGDYDREQMAANLMRGRDMAKAPRAEVRRRGELRGWHSATAAISLVLARHDHCSTDCGAWVVRELEQDGWRVRITRRDRN